MKPKGEITYMPNTTIKEIKIAVHIISAIAIIVCVIGIVLGANLMILSAEYEALEREKQALEELAEIQKNMINDLEINCTDLFIQVEELKEEYVYGKENL